MLIQALPAGVSETQRSAVGAVDVGEIGGVGIGIGSGQWVGLRHGSHHLRSGSLAGLGVSGNRHQAASPHQQHQQQAQHALRQTEEETGTTTQHASGADGANGKDLRDFAVLLDNALTIDKAKTVGRLYGTTLLRRTLVADGLGVEETSQLVSSTVTST